ncbi:MAG TPA: hypothetical protein ENI87_08505 [bacterium]|nr:hypothetical protein [bacterium]
MRPLLAHRWPLLFVGGAMVVLGNLIAWAMFLQSGAVLDQGPRLRRGPTGSATGEITELLPARHFDGADWCWTHYRFPWRKDGQTMTLHGMCFVPAGTHALGDGVTVDVLLADDNVHCIRGGKLRQERRWLYARFWLGAMAVPGALILLVWAAGLFQLRRVLVHGDVSVGTVLTVTPVPWILPEMLSVRYEFRDHHARLRKNRHWVRARGALGRRLLQHGRRPDEALPVLHDRRVPNWNRMLLPEDFLAGGGDPDPHLPTT